MVIRNDSAAVMTPTSLSPASMFTRFRVLAGIEIEDVSDYGRMHQMRQMLKSSAEQMSDLCEGWGGTELATQIDIDNNEPIPAGGERRVLCHFYSSLFNQPKKLILSAMSNLTVELELGDDTLCFKEATAKYTILRPTFLCSVLSLQADVVNGFSKHLLGGFAISWNMPEAVFHMKATVTSASF